MEICRSPHFLKVVGHFEHKFQMEGASPTNHRWCHKTRVIALSCGITISAVHCLVLSFTKHACDGQTLRQTDGWKDRQNYNSYYHTSIVACMVKTGWEFRHK